MNSATEEDSPIVITVKHEGTDGLQMTFVDVVTSSRAVHCPVNSKLDGDEFVQINCLG